VVADFSLFFVGPSRGHTLSLQAPGKGEATLSAAFVVLVMCAHWLLTEFFFDLQQWHPDRHKGDDMAKRRFQQIQEAYEGAATAVAFCTTRHTSM
jgi:hypothetical protein